MTETTRPRKTLHVVIPILATRPCGRAEQTWKLLAAAISGEIHLFGC
jgi:hypothetical protein